WDGFGHAFHPRYGFYNFTTKEQVMRGERNGIEHWARRGIAGRGVLLDVARHERRKGNVIGGDTFRITPELLDEVAAAERVEIQAGDILLIRSGWTEHYLNADRATREAMNDSGTPGLHAGIPTAAWLWNRRIAAVAGDTPAVEANPTDPA